jgi:hypothetical protein
VGGSRSVQGRAATFGRARGLATAARFRRARGSATAARLVILAVGLALGLTSLTGCNELFDLQPTVPLPPDTDGDGVVDPDDNCQQLANAEQADDDADGFGDTCDGCRLLATATNHDEDGDRRGDECDRCPNIADFDADFDKDNVPDECDMDVGTTTLLGFDPFVALDDRWRSGGAAWSAHDDSIAPDASLATIDTGLQDPSLVVEGTSWYVDIGVSSSRRWRDGDRFGVGVRADNGDLLACEIVCAPDCMYMLTVPGSGAFKVGTAAPVPITRMRLTSRPTTTSRLVLCEIIGDTNVFLTSAATVAGHPTIFGSPDLEITHFAAWRNEPP